MLAESARRKGLELSCFVPPALPAVLRGDPTRLRQILMNLVGNAIKFTPQGHVAVTVSNLHRTPVQLTIKVSITDTGVGVAPESHRRIFEAFSQADGSTTRQYGGTGLGLTIVKQLVQLMGGTVGIESALGAGSTFWFTLTLGYRQDQPVPGPPCPLTDAPVLAVDDNETNRQILQEYLRAWGMRPDVVATAEEALRLLHSHRDSPHPYVLGLLDIHMPGMDGVALAQQIKQIPAWAALPLVALSSTDSTDTGMPLTSSGFADALRKPIHPFLLRQCLENVLRRAAQTTSDSSSITAPVPPPRLTTIPRVLLVEDNPINRDVCVAMLDLLGFRVDIAVNGMEAIGAVRRSSFDLILMDCQMPVINGFDATTEIRRWETAAPLRRRTPIIALTANAMQGDRERCNAAGMDDYLAKPFTQRQLKDILNRWLDRADDPPTSDTPESASSECPAMALAASPPVEAESTTPMPHAKSINPAGLVDFTAWEPIRMLARPGALSLLGKLLAAYLEDAPQLVDQLRKAIRSKDSSAIGSVAHQLKSSSAMLGALTVAARCSELEIMGRSRLIEDAQSRFTQLEQDFESVRSIFQAALIKENAA
ncbi:MAG: response regulator, partial [Nitrospira sp.]|nr:response regulator [Nitrospira sp.]